MSFNLSGDYEDLLNAFKSELESNNLQSFPLNFFIKYNELNDSLPSKASSNALIRIIHSRMLRMLDEIYHLRRNKIILSVLQKSEQISTEILSQAEKRFYFTLIIANTFLSASKKIVTTNPPSELKNEFIRSLPPDWIKEIKQTDSSTPTIASNQNLEVGDALENGQVLVLKPIPKFLGPDNKIYGPYEPDSVISVPLIIINNVLIPFKLSKLIL